MKYKETNKQKYYMRNVYINQIMKPEIQNNLNYAYFENPGVIPNYNNNPNIDINQDNIIFNNKPIAASIYQNKYPNKKETISQKKIKNQRYFQNQFIEMNDPNLFMNNINKRNCQINNNFNERKFSENKINNFNLTQTFFKKSEKNNDCISNLKGNRINKYSTIIKRENKNEIDNDVDDVHFFDNNNMKNTINGNISCKNTKCNSPLKVSVKSKKNYHERNNNQIYDSGKNTYYAEMNKNEINQINNIININNTCSTSPNVQNNNYFKFNRGSIEEKNTKKSNNKLSRKINQIKSYENDEQFQNQFYKSSERNSSRNVVNNNNNYINKYKSPQRQNEDYIYMDNISSLNSPSIPSYSSIIDDNSVNSKNFVWIKKNIKNNKISNNMDNNIIHQNLINFANDITNINPYLYKTEVIFPNFINQKNRRAEKMELMEHSATTIQAAFRGYIVKKKFDITYHNYKYYYHKGLEILELILNYFFQKHVNISKEKRKFFNYLISLKKPKKNYANKTKTKPKSYGNFKQNKYNLPFSPMINNGKIISKFYQDLFLHKEIGERFNIIKQDNREKDIEQKYKEKIEVINIKVNKLSKENNVLKDINQKNIIMERKFREISKENKKKDDIINIITNDNKTLARKLKIIKDKFNKLQIQNQEDINYNSAKELFDKNNEIDLFEEYRNLFLSLIIYKKHEKYYLSILRKYLYKWKSIISSFKSNDRTNMMLKKQKLKYLIYNNRNKERHVLYKNFIKLHYLNLFHKKEIEIENNIKKCKLLNIFKNKERAIKSNLKKYFYEFYYKGIISQRENMENRNIIKIGKDNYGKIKQLLNAIKFKIDNRNKHILREYLIKWHLYTKVLALKTLINDRRRKKKQKQKLKKKNENEANNKFLTNNKILHFGKSNIYILNKDKEKELLISLDDNNKKYLSTNENKNVDNKLNNIIEASNKLGDLFYKAASKYKYIEDEEINKNDIKNIDNNDKLDENKIYNKNNDVEEEEDSGDSFGI